MTSEGEAPILKKNPTEIRFDEKLVNNGGKGFLLTTKFYKIANNTALLSPKKWKLEGKAFLHTEGTYVKNQEKTTTKELAPRKIHTNELHVKLCHTGEERMCAAINNIHHMIKGTIEICEDCAKSKASINCYIY